MPIYKCPECQLPASTLRVELCPACRKPAAPPGRPQVNADPERGEVELAGGGLLLLVSFTLAGVAVAGGIPQMVNTALWVFTLGIVPFLTGLLRVTKMASDEH